MHEDTVANPDPSESRDLTPEQQRRVYVLQAARRVLGNGSLFGGPGNTPDRTDLEMLAEWIIGVQEPEGQKSNPEEPENSEDVTERIPVEHNQDGYVRFDPIDSGGSARFEMRDIRYHASTRVGFFVMTNDGHRHDFPFASYARVIKMNTRKHQPYCELDTDHNGLCVGGF